MNRVSWSRLIPSRDIQERLQLTVCLCGISTQKRAAQLYPPRHYFFKEV